VPTSTVSRKRILEQYIILVTAAEAPGGEFDDSSTNQTESAALRVASLLHGQQGAVCVITDALNDHLVLRRMLERFQGMNELIYQPFVFPEDPRRLAANPRPGRLAQLLREAYLCDRVVVMLAEADVIRHFLSRASLNGKLQALDAVVQPSAVFRLKLQRQRLLGRTTLTLNEVLNHPVPRSYNLPISLTLSKILDYIGKIWKNRLVHSSSKGERMSLVFAFKYLLDLLQSRRTWKIVLVPAAKPLDDVNDDHLLNATVNRISELLGDEPASGVTWASEPGAQNTVILGHHASRIASRLDAKYYATSRLLDTFDVLSNGGRASRLVWALKHNKIYGPLVVVATNRVIKKLLGPQYPNEVQLLRLDTHGPLLPASLKPTNSLAPIK